MNEKSAHGQDSVRTNIFRKLISEYRTEDLREWGDLIRSCVVKKKDEFGQVGTRMIPGWHLVDTWLIPG